MLSLRRTVGWGRSVASAFIANRCTMHAAGLTYFSLLAVVPVLCCVLVAAKLCGVDRYAKERINERIDAMILQVETAPGDAIAGLPIISTGDAEARRIAAEEFGRRARQISNELFGRIAGFDVGTLGWVGFAFLLWTALSALMSVEDSFNGIFGVAAARPFFRRCVMYLFLLIALPVMLTVVMSLPVLKTVKLVIASTIGASYLTRWASDGLLALLDSRLAGFALTYLAMAFSFGFFYWMIPNCRVQARAAAIGGVMTALAFGGWLRICAIAQVGIAKSSALYGSFAFLPIVLAWLYIGWQIVLLGAVVVRSLERPDTKRKDGKK